MKIKTSDLTGATLDWAVEVSLNRKPKAYFIGQTFKDNHSCGMHNYSTDWAQGGPIIEDNAIQLTPDEYAGTWTAYTTNEGEPYEFTGPTPLIAAMRCFVASKLGDDMEVPDELI
jgi:hypothetical protein